jgi:hypothetical protein
VTDLEMLVGNELDPTSYSTSRQLLIKKHAHTKWKLGGVPCCWNSKNQGILSHSWSLHYTEFSRWWLTGIPTSMLDIGFVFLGLQI